MELPIILNKQCVVVVAQTNLISRRRQATNSSLRKEPRIYRPKSDEVRNRRKELKVQNGRLEAVDMGPQEIPTKLHIMITKELVGIRRKRSVLLVQCCSRCIVAKSGRTQVSEKRDSRIRGKHIECSAYTSVRVSRARFRSISAITSAQCKNPG